jgi:benzoyl-CoA reductase subunit C
MNQEKPPAGSQLVTRYYEDYGSRAREMRAEGRRFIGYLCAYVPLEIISAAGLVPFRVKGNAHEPITLANTHLETIVCPVVRSCFDTALKDAYDFIEGMVIPHSCDSMCITHDVWRSTLDLPYFHLINLPHALSGGALEFFTESLRTFRTSLERFIGAQITDHAIVGEIGHYNAYRGAVRELYETRRTDDIRIGGTEMVRTLMAAVSLPVAEATALVRGVTREVADRRVPTGPEKPRIMITGSEQDDDGFCRVVEECGANVAVDFLCPGLREYGTDVAVDADPIAALAKRYLNLYCARTYHERPGDRTADFENRFGPVGRLVKDYRIQGVILRVHRCCDPYGLEVPAMRAYLQSLGVAVLYLEDDYSILDTGRLRTRIQAFLELVGQHRGQGDSNGG